MKTDLNSHYEMLERHFASLKKPKTKRVMECMLPADAVLFLYDHVNSLRIDMLVEKRGKEDYVIIQIDEDNKRVYLFQVFLDALRERFSLQGFAIVFPDRYNQKIMSLLAKLKAM